MKVKNANEFLPKINECGLILGRIKDAPNQSTMKVKQWRE